MNNELLAIVNYMEKDRGLDREVVIQAVESALQTAARKNLGVDQDVRVSIDRKTGDIRGFSKLKVVEQAKPGAGEVALDRARQVKPDAQPGELIEGFASHLG